MKRTTAKFPGALVRRLLVAIAIILGSAQMATADPAVWVVKNGNSTLYLMGTLAIMKMDSSRWYTPKIDGVLQAIDEYWMAHDQLADDAIGKTYTMNFGVDYQHPLAEKLGPEDYALLVELLQKHGVREGEIRFFRPWAATLTLQSRVFKANG